MYLNSRLLYIIITFAKKVNTMFGNNKIHEIRKINLRLKKDKLRELLIKKNIVYKK